MRTILVLFSIFLLIKSIDNSQCTARSDLAGRCGCCRIIGGSCIYYDTIDGIDVSWHLCVPEHLKDNFTLAQCKPNTTMDKNGTRLCRTKHGIFRLFPQCTLKQVCSLPTSQKNFTPQCHTEMAVKGSCGRSLKRYSYNSTERRCVPFLYSGCGGSTNRFRLRNRCERICKKLLSKS